MKKGPEGFLHKSCENSEAIHAVTTVLTGREYVSECVQHYMLQYNSHTQLIPSDPIKMLSPREQQVLTLLLSEKWFKEIAAELNAEISTVGTQKNRIHKKLKVDDMIELARKYGCLKVRLTTNRLSPPGKTTVQK